MNIYQRVVLMFGAIAVTALALFPPWSFVFQQRSVRMERFAGYYPIWHSNAPTDAAALSKLFSTTVGLNDLPFFSIRLDITRLSVQLIATVIVSLILCMILSKPKRRKDE